jgi:hypothetical protein
MRTKIIILISFLSFSLIAYSQKTIHFEQIAFEFYKDSILKNKSENVTVSLKVIEDGSYWNIDCLKEFNIRIDDTVASVVSAIGTVDLDIGNDKRFKVKKYKKSKLPMVFATSFMSFDTDKNITGIVENNNGSLTTYLFDINREGEIKKWCKGEFKN